MFDFVKNKQKKKPTLSLRPFSPPPDTKKVYYKACNQITGRETVLSIINCFFFFFKFIWFSFLLKHASGPIYCITSTIMHSDGMPTNWLMMRRGKEDNEKKKVKGWKRTVAAAYQCRTSGWFTGRLDEQLLVSESVRKKKKKGGSPRGETHTRCENFLHGLL